jgi:hypothetical protein
MGKSVMPPRRWYGFFCLILAGAMLLWGQTLLQTRLSGKAYIIYWTLCFLVTGLALIISLWDTFRLKRLMRQEEKELLKTVWDQIEKAKQEKCAQPNSSPLKPSNPPDSPSEKS